MIIELGDLQTTVVSAQDHEKAWLRQYLSFDDQRAAFAARRYGGNGKLRMFNLLTETFPTGFVPMVKRAALLEGITITLVDKRAKPCAADPNADLAWLRDYQLAAVQAAAKAGRGIIWVPTGGGKTELAVALARVFPTDALFLVHRTTLVEQSAERYELRTGNKAGQIGEGKWDDQHPFVAATFQTIYQTLKNNPQKAKAFLARFGLLFIDECFPAGTKIGETPIESVRVGDLVPSFDQVTGTFCRRPVVRKFVRTPSALVRLWFADKAPVVCTPGHPFLTARGWLPAYSLCGQDVLLQAHENTSVRQMRYTASENYNEREPFGLLQTVSEGSLERTAESGRSPMRDLRDSDHAIGTARTRTCAAAAYLLYDSLPDSGSNRVVPTNCAVEGYSKFRAHESKQSFLRAGGAREDFSHASAYRASSALDWWEGSRDDQAAADAPRGSWGWVGSRVPSDDQPCAQSSKLHLLRPSAPSIENGCGGGRTYTRHLESERCRPPQGGVPSWARVERVEVLEPGRDGTFRGLCPDGLVYNLSVEGTNTFVADGLVVHNCHTLPSDSFWSVAMATPAHYRFGLSGTPLARGDKRSVLAVGALGPVVYRIKPDVLIQAGVLAKPKIRLVQVVQRSDRPTWQGVYGESVVRSVARNKAVVDCAKRAEKPCLVFVKEITHGKLVKKALEQSGLNAEFVYGQDDTSERREAIKRLVRGDSDVLVCSVVFQEGIDIPQLRSVVIASGGKSVIAALQRIGRGMRKSTGKDEFEVHDIADKGCGCGSRGHAGCRWLEKHTKARVKAYAGEGFEVAIGGA